MIPLVDYHVHLDLYPDHVEIARSCSEQGIQVFTMTTTPLAWEKNVEMVKGLSGIRVGLGLHPQLVAEREGEMEMFEKLAPQATYIGEIGLDAGPRFYKSFDAQQRVLNRILKAVSGSAPKIISLHSVRCAGKVLDAIEPYCSEEGLKFVLHWFTGSKSEAARAAKLGCYFSINSMMLRTDAGRKLVLSLPLNRILSETDGPFTHDAQGEISTPAAAIHCVRGVAQLHGISDEALKEIIWKNTLRLEEIFSV